MDLFTTALSLTGAKPPADKVIDGIDLSPVLFNQNITDRSVVNNLGLQNKGCPLKY